jgi:hypothetical protein
VPDIIVASGGSELLQAETSNTKSQKYNLIRQNIFVTNSKRKSSFFDMKSV